MFKILSSPEPKSHWWLTGSQTGMVRGRVCAGEYLAVLRFVSQGLRIHSCLQLGKPWVWKPGSSSQSQSVSSQEIS